MALTADVSRVTLGTNTPPVLYPVKASQTFYKGSIVTMKNGLLYNATNSDNTHVAIGVASIALTSTQTSGGDGAANGGADLLVEPGTFGYFTPDAASNNPTFANVQTTVYVVDDDTLSTSSNGSARCSVTLYSVSDDDGVSLAAQFGQVLP
jgi:hypothetical protein